MSAANRRPRCEVVIGPEVPSPLLVRTVSTGWVLAAAFLFVSVLGQRCELSALKAAGLMSTVPPGGAIFQQLLSTLQSDAEWFMGTGIGLMVVLVSAMLIFGVQRAPDYFFRIAGGVAGVLILAPAIMA